MRGIQRCTRRPALARADEASSTPAQGQWWATAVLLLTSGMLGGIVARVDGAPAVRISSGAG
jgi:hypothetical protein